MIYECKSFHVQSFQFWVVIINVILKGVQTSRYPMTLGTFIRIPSFNMFVSHVALHHSSLAKVHSARHTEERTVTQLLHISCDESFYKNKIKREPL